MISLIFPLQWIGIDDCRKPIKHGPTLAGLPGGLAGELGRLYPVQSDQDYPVKVREEEEPGSVLTLLYSQEPISGSSSALLVLPYSLSRAKHNKRLEILFNSEFQTFSELLQSSSQSLLLKQNRPGGQSEILGLVAAWQTEHLGKTTATDLCSRFFGKLANSPSVREKFRLVVKIFAASPVMLDTALWEDILESFSHNTEELIVVTNEKNESLSRFLRLEKWQDLKTDFLLCGQELLVKPV